MSALVRKDYEDIFWATGQMNINLWEPDCLFADPFSSFGGNGSTLRFKKNADGLAKMVIDPSLRITNFDVIPASTTDEMDVIRVGWVFKSQLKLPWRPVLAAAGETAHFLSTQTGRIAEYRESWSSKPWDVIMRLLKPGRKS